MLEVNSYSLKNTVQPSRILLWTTIGCEPPVCDLRFTVIIYSWSCRLIQIRVSETYLSASNRLLNLLSLPSPKLFPIPLAGLFYRKSISCPLWLDYFCFHRVILSQRSGGCLIVTPSPWKGFKGLSFLFYRF